MKIRITKKMLMQALAPMVKQYAAGYSPTLSKYEELRELLFDLERNVKHPEVIEVLKGVVKGGNVADGNRAKRVVNKLFQYLDSIKGDEKKMADLERKIATFNPERKSGLERAQTLTYDDEDDDDDDDEYVERQVEEDKPVKEGKTFKANDANKKPQDYRKQRAEKEKAQGLKESRSKKN